MEPQVDLPELLYIYDPLCSWCYGMTPVIQRVQQAFKGRINVSVLNGGMVVGEQVGPIRERWPYIEASLATIEQIADVQFGEAFRKLGEEGSYVQDSEPPCRALAIFRQLDTTQSEAINFAHAIQKALFIEGQDLNDPATYDALIASYPVNASVFRQHLASANALAATQQEFAAVGRIGVKGFPTSILRSGNQGYVLARGFQPYETFAAGLEQALEQAQEETGA